LAGGSFNKGAEEDPKEKYNNLIKRGKTLTAEGQWTEAITKLANSVRVARDAKQPKWELTSYRLIGDALSKKGDVNKAVNYYKKALDMAQKIDDKQGQAYIFRGLGLIHMSKGDLEKADEYFQFFRKVAEEMKMRPMLGNAYIDMADIAAERGDFAIAIDNYKKGIEVLETTDEHVDLARAFSNLGNAYKLSGDYGTALTYYEMAMEECAKYGNVHRWALTESMVAECCTKLGLVIRAMETLESSRDVLMRLEDNVGLGELYRISGLLQASQGNWSAGKVHFEKSAKLLEDQDRPLKLANTYIEYGRMLLLRNDLAGAKEKLEKARELSSRVESKRLLEIVEMLLKEIK
jgi:tetratricopeptide (TPR) repeat protein